MKAAIFVLAVVCCLAAVEATSGITKFTFNSFSPSQYKFLLKPSMAPSGKCGDKGFFDCGVQCGEAFCLRADKKCGDKKCKDTEVCFKNKCLAFECIKGKKCVQVVEKVCKDVCKKVPETVCKEVKVNACKPDAGYSGRKLSGVKAGGLLNAAIADSSATAIATGGSSAFASSTATANGGGVGFGGGFGGGSGGGGGGVVIKTPILCPIVTKTVCEVVEVEKCTVVCNDVKKIVCSDEDCGDDSLVACGGGFCFPGDECIMPKCAKKCIFGTKFTCW